MSMYVYLCIDTYFSYTIIYKDTEDCMYIKHPEIFSELLSWCSDSTLSTVISALLIRAGRTASIRGFLDIGRSFMCHSGCILLGASLLMACVILKEKTSATPGCDMYSAQLVFVSHRPLGLTQLQPSPLPSSLLRAQECEAWLPLGSKNASGWVL